MLVPPGFWSRRSSRAFRGERFLYDGIAAFGYQHLTTTWLECIWFSVYQMGMCQSILYHMTGGMNVDNHQLLGYKVKFLLLMVMFPSICHCRRVPVFLLPRCYEYNEWFLAAKNSPDDLDFSSNWNPKIRCLDMLDRNFCCFNGFNPTLCCLNPLSASDGHRRAIARSSCPTRRSNQWDSGWPWMVRKPSPFRAFLCYEHVWSIQIWLGCWMIWMLLLETVKDCERTSQISKRVEIQWDTTSNMK